MTEVYIIETSCYSHVTKDGQRQFLNHLGEIVETQNQNDVPYWIDEDAQKAIPAEIIRFKFTDGSPMIGFLDSQERLIDRCLYSGSGRVSDITKFIQDTPELNIDIQGTLEGIKNKKISLRDESTKACVIS